MASLILVILALGSVVDGPIQPTATRPSQPPNTSPPSASSTTSLDGVYATDLDRRSDGKPEVTLTVTTTYVGGAQLDRLMRRKLPKTVLRTTCEAGGKPRWLSGAGPHRVNG